MASSQTGTPMLHAAPDGEVVAAILLGDELAADELFHRVHLRLIRRMAYWTRDRGLVDDLAQDAWLKAVAALDRFDQDAPFWPWLRCIADNLARSDLRKRLVPSGEERVVYLDDDTLAQSPTEFDDQARVDDSASLCGALHAIPERQRKAFLAVAYSGATMAVAARQFDLNENAFRQLYHRARRSLREQLEGVLGVAPLMAWQRWRDAVKDAFAPASSVTLAQGTAAVVGIVTIVVLGPAMDTEGRASTVAHAPSPAAVDAAHHEGADLPRRANRSAAVDAAREVGRLPRALKRTGEQREVPSLAHKSPYPTNNDRVSDTAGGAAARAKKAEPVAEAPSVQVGRAGIRGHQKPPAEPDFHYGVRVDPPGGQRQQIGYKSKNSRLQPVHELVCDVAATSPVTYCDS